MSKHPLQKETPYTSPPILPKSESGHELLGLSSRTSNIKNQGSRYHCDEELMKKNRVRDYHQAEQALQRGQYAEAERICYDIVDNGSEKCCSEGIMARANMLLARPEVTKDLKDREYYASEAIAWWEKIIVHHEQGHLNDVVTYPYDMVYSKYPADLAKWQLEEARELFDDALTELERIEEEQEDESGDSVDDQDDSIDEKPETEDGKDPVLSPRADTPMGMNEEL